MTPRYSLVVPFYNEAGNILPLVESAEGRAEIEAHLAEKRRLLRRMG